MDENNDVMYKDDLMDLKEKADALVESYQKVWNDIRSLQKENPDESAQLKLKLIYICNDMVERLGGAGDAGHNG